MKKILSLLLVCTVIFSLATISMVSADGEGYTITAGTINSVKSGKSYVMQFDNSGTYAATNVYDASWSNVVYSGENIALKVVTNTAASAGYVAIDYDESKVTPVTLAIDSTEIYKNDDTSFEWATGVAGDATVTENTEATAVNDGNLVVTWTGSMSANDVICYITFLCNEGVTTEDFDSNTFTISNNADFIDTYKLKNGGAYVMYSGTDYQVASTSTLTYPNSDKSAGGDDTPIAEDFADDTNLSTDGYYAEAEEITSGTVSYGNTQIDMGANGKVHTFFAKAAADLEALSYGVEATINGNKYKFPGKAKVEKGKAWAIKIVIPNGTFKDDVAAEITDMVKY